MVGQENELAYFHEAVRTPDGAGGFTTTHEPIAFNPVWVSVRDDASPMKGMNEEQAIKWQDNKTIRFRINNLWTPTKSMVVKIREKWFSIGAYRNVGYRDEYYEMVLFSIDH